MLDRRTRSGPPTATTESAERLTPGRVTVVVAGCTGVLSVFLWFGPALGTYVFGSLLATSLLALAVSVVTRLVPEKIVVRLSTVLVDLERSAPDCVSIGRVRPRSSIHRPGACLALAVAAVVLFVWSAELDTVRSGYAAATLAGGLSYAVLASQLPWG